MDLEHRLQEKLIRLRRDKYPMSKRPFCMNYSYGYPIEIYHKEKRSCTPEFTAQIKERIAAGDPMYLEFHSIFTQMRLLGREVRGWP